MNDKWMDGQMFHTLNWADSSVIFSKIELQNLMQI